MTRRTEVTSVEALEAILGKPVERVANKARAALHPLDVAWLAASPFCLVATANARGECDVSPKGDPPGFTLVLDERTIALPERPGNKRGDGFHNILENPHVGLLYFIPGRGDTLRINGRATILSEAPYMKSLEAEGHEPKLAIEVAIDEIFHHCAKAFLRSGLYAPDTWHPQRVPSRAEIAKALEQPEADLEALERYYGPDYANKLYKE